MKTCVKVQSSYRYLQEVYIQKMISKNKFRLDPVGALFLSFSMSKNRTVKHEIFGNWRKQAGQFVFWRIKIQKERSSTESIMIQSDPFFSEIWALPASFAVWFVAGTCMNLWPFPWHPCGHLCDRQDIYVWNSWPRPIL